MNKFELFEFKDGILHVKGYSLEKFDKIVIKSSKNFYKEFPFDQKRIDLRFVIKNYDDSFCYGYNFCIEIKKNNFSIYFVRNGKLFKIYRTNNYFLRKKISRIKHFFDYLFHGIKILWKDYHFIVPLKKQKEFLKIFYRKVFKKELYISSYYNQFLVEDYNKWLLENEKETVYKKLKYNPKFSIVIPVYNVSSKLLSECIDSVLNQKYKNFEICLADDCSTMNETLETLKKYEHNYPDVVKVVYRKKNGHISEATNSALSIATGDYIGLLDNDDILEENALYENALVINEDLDIDFIYSDEDKINLDGRRCDPHFKPNFSPDTLYSHNYICHFAVIRKTLIDKIGGFRKGYEGAQDYDLFLRVVEKTSKIFHIPKILYHWRMIPGSTSMEVNNKSYASINGVKALEDMLNRKKIKGTIENIYTSYLIKYKIIGNPLVSIIIPTRDKVDVLRNCIDSIFSKTMYNKFEIIVVDNGSVEKSTLNYFDEIKSSYLNIKVVRVDDEFNYSMLNNIGVKNSNGDYIIMLNNDIEIISPDWIEVMLGYAQQDHIGAVGPKLLFANGKIQHAGVVVGVGEGHIANHAFYLEDRFSAAPAGRLMVPYNYSAVTGACILISKKKYNEVYGLSEEFAVNYNDIDFCLKLLEKGYYNVFLPQIELYHLESISRGKINNTKKQEQLLCEQETFRKKWKKKILFDKFYNINYSLNSCFKLDKKGEKNEKR